MSISRRAEKVILIAVLLVLGLAIAASTFGIFGPSARAVELPPITHKLSVFAHEPAPTADLPSAVVAAEADLPESAGLGSAITGQVRILADGFGRNAADLYAFPTTHGAVCLVITESTTMETCVPELRPERGNVEFGIYSGRGVGQTIVGIAADSVKSVGVVVDGTVYESALRNNAFVWQSRDRRVRRESLAALVIRMHDGTVVRRNLAFAR